MAIQKTAIIILGASGDLAKRKLIPALDKLFSDGEIDSTCRIIGSGRTKYTNEEFRNRFKVCCEFQELLFYHSGIEGLKEYTDSLSSFDKYIIFTALPPRVYASTAEALFNEGFRENSSLIIEKPFGQDYETAKKLNEDLSRYYKEEQIYRIDHYLAKEAVQNILVFRFANTFLYPVWNSKYIESIQISASEEIGVENRGEYFDHSGILRDMVQNHLTQLLSLITMEAPVTLDAEDIRDQKLAVLKALEFTRYRSLQYDGYQKEEGVAKGSQTETYAELEARINNFRWTGMPVYIRAGKALHRKGTEIGITFRKMPKLLFNQDGNLPANRIIFNIQPAEGIIMDMASKVPGGEIKITNTNMKFCYKDSFTNVEIPEAYQKLLLDALKGDKTLYVSAKETELSWKKIAPVLDKGLDGTYRQGTLPHALDDIAWIDFERYGSACTLD